MEGTPGAPTYLAMATSLFSWGNGGRACLSSFGATPIFEGMRRPGGHRAVGDSGATGAGTRLATAELEVRGIERAGEAAFPAPGMNSSDELLRELPGAHPYAGGNSRVLGCKFGLEAGFSYSHPSAPSVTRQRTTFPASVPWQVSAGVTQT